MAQHIRGGIKTAKRYPKAEISLHFIIVGGGIAGLATAFALSLVGHRVTVIEESDGRIQTNNGVTCPPNMSKILQDWGLQSWLDQVGGKVANFRLTAAHSGDELGVVHMDTKYAGKIESDFFFLLYDDLYTLLRSLVDIEGVEVLLNRKVVDIDTHAVSVTLSGDSVQASLKADVIIGADGKDSLVRSVVNSGSFIKEVPTGSEPADPAGLVISSAVFQTKVLTEDPELAMLLEPHLWTLWCGNKYYATGALCSPDLYYVVMFSEVSSNATSAVEDIKNDWKEDLKYGTNKLKLDHIEHRKSESEARFHKLLDLAGDQLRSMRYDGFGSAYLENAVDDSGSVCLVGDAGHPIVPYSWHSAALGVEDACTLLHLFAGIQRHDQIPRLLNAYEEIRQPRWENILDAEKAYRTELAMPPGPARDARDQFFGELARMNSTFEEEDDEVVSEDVERLRMAWIKTMAAYNFDAREAVDDWFSKWGGILHRTVDLSEGVEDDFKTK
ncbi:hypothetical protein BDV98DRAFT_569772 [Pterulicium gracile]|uniref:FAD-binding domain-containing protein n=1 Tax=Pterulicium gracile TaxID=1884261 RepID=A0A5C3QEC0_9AGAR|nr:hypothetical protein BDV98DRAFT_569772 [Pterula gracilis]